METLLIIGIIAVALLMLRPTPRTEVIYVPVTFEQSQESGVGCLLPIIVAIVVLVALGITGV